MIAPTGSDAFLARPATSVPSTLQTLREESESATTPAQASESAEQDGVMKATMTDVQKAIEQLGRTNGDTDRDDKDGRRSFSFTTVSREETDTEEEHLDENWAKGARKRLAEVVAQGAMSMDYDAEKMEIERRLKPP